MKRILLTLIAILFYNLVLIGCTISGSLNTKPSNSITYDNATMVFAKLPSPPKCKKIDDIEIIKKIIYFIDN